MRALLAAAMVAVAMLASTVVVLAADDDAASAGSSSHRVVPVGATLGEQMTLRRSAVIGKATPVRSGTRYDGGPDEGTRGPGR
jgi:hypothetical protein